MTFIRREFRKNEGKNKILYYHEHFCSSIPNYSFRLYFLFISLIIFMLFLYFFIYQSSINYLLFFTFLKRMSAAPSSPSASSSSLLNIYTPHFVTVFTHHPKLFFPMMSTVYV